MLSRFCYRTASGKSGLKMPMRIYLLAMITALLASMMTPLDVAAQPPPPPQQGAPNNAQFTSAQLDQMLAPIALYPDALLAQILMAATYPLEVVEAHRWLQEPANAALQGDALNAALEQRPWDPSVKSLVPFPQVLSMMDSNLNWTEQLGDAFLANQGAVMDSVQGLRQRAKAAGKLQSSSQAVVSNQGSNITIDPPAPTTVYVPVYNPQVVYGPWPYPAYPPFYFPGFFNGVAIGGLGFGWFGIGINVSLWGWSHWDWGGHRVYINQTRFNVINVRRPPATSGVWQHDPWHRAGVPYRDPAVRARFQGNRAPDVSRGYRGYSTPVGQPPHSIPGPSHGAPSPRVPGSPQSQHGPSPQMSRPSQPQHAPPPSMSRPPQSQRTPSPPQSYESFGHGSDVHNQSERGQMSRQSMPPAEHGPSGDREHR